MAHKIRAGANHWPAEVGWAHDAVVSASPAPRVRYRDALAVGEFRALYSAYTVSVLGNVVSTVGLTVLVYERTSSPLLSSLAFALGFLPYLLSGLLLSAVVDRLPARRLLVTCDLTSAVVVATMAWPRTPLPALFGLLLVVSVVTSVSSGARAGIVREVVGDAAFVPARSLMRISAQTAQIAGNGVGGALLVVLSPRTLILANSASFVFSAVVTRVGLRHRPAAAAATGTVLMDSLRGAGAVLGVRPLRRLLLFGWLVPMFSVFPESLAAPYVIGSGDSRALVGWWLTALPVGVIVGDLAGVWVLSPARQKRWMARLAVLGFLPYLLFVFEPPVPVAMALLAVAGLGSASSLGLDARVRDTAPHAIFARVMTINSAGLMTIQGLGFAAAGALGETLSPGLVVALAGAGGLLTIAVLRPRLGARPVAATAPDARVRPRRG